MSDAPSRPTLQPSGADRDTAHSDGADIRLAAMNLLARREHSLGELRRKLLTRFGDERAVETELQRLVEEHLQSDQRFAQSFARSRALRGYGPARLRQEMRDKHLSDADIAEAFETAELDWYTLAETVFRKKFGEPGPVDRVEQARRMRFMQYRGFATDHYRHLVDY